MASEPGQTGGWTCGLCGRRFARKPGRHSCVRMSADGFLGADADAREAFHHVDALMRRLGAVEQDVTRTQVAWLDAAGRRLAWFWVPGRALGRDTKEHVVSFALPRPERSPRVKEATQVGKRWIHHAVLGAGPVDAELERLLRLAAAAATRDG